MEDILEKYNETKLKKQENFTNSQKAWDEIKYSYTQNYRPLNKFHLNRNYGHEYNMHNDEETVVDNQYWEKKEVDAFYSLSRFERIRLYFQSMVSFFYDLRLFLLINILVVFFYARKRTREILVSNL